LAEKLYMRGPAEDDGSTHKAVALCIHHHIVAASTADLVQPLHTSDPASARASTAKLLFEQGLLPKQLLPYAWRTKAHKEQV